MHELTKADWGPGDWQNEPDRLEWEHAGHPCLMVRNMYTGNWCGYAAVEPGHPWYGMSYSGGWRSRRSPDARIDVHGGLTYSDSCRGHICHKAKPGKTDDVWWFGFDCGHHLDYSPGLQAVLRQIDPDFQFKVRPTYRDVAYVQSEVNRLAEQLRSPRHYRRSRRAR